MKKELSARIQKAIEESRLSYTAISEIIGTISPQAVRAWAVGLSTPTNENISLLAKATNADEVWLLTGREQQDLDKEINECSNEESTRLRELIRQSQISQTELAEACGVSKQAVSKWAIGSAFPRSERVLILLAKALNTTPEYIRYGNESTTLEMPNKKLSRPTNNFERVKAVIRLTNSDDQKAIFALYLALDENQEILLSRIKELENELNQNLSNIIDRWFIKTVTSAKPIIPLSD